MCLTVQSLNGGHDIVKLFCGLHRLFVRVFIQTYWRVRGVACLVAVRISRTDSAPLRHDSYRNWWGTHTATPDTPPPPKKKERERGTTAIRRPNWEIRISVEIWIFIYLTIGALSVHDEVKMWWGTYNIWKLWHAFVSLTHRTEYIWNLRVSSRNLEINSKRKDSESPNHEIVK